MYYVKALTVYVWQVECHPYFRNEAMLEWCKANNIHMTAYSPLGSPDSASMFRRKAPLLMQDPAVQAIAAKLNRSAAQVITIITIVDMLGFSKQTFTKQKAENSFCMLSAQVSCCKHTEIM